MAKLQATVYYRKAGFIRRSRTPILPGWRAEVIDGLPDGVSVYTGVCETRTEALTELAQQARRVLGEPGSIRVV